jgi:hypothetical protein
VRIGASRNRCVGRGRSILPEQLGPGAIERVEKLLQRVWPNHITRDDHALSSQPFLNVGFTHLLASSLLVTAPLVAS